MPFVEEICRSSVAFGNLGIVVVWKFFVVT